MKRFRWQSRVGATVAAVLSAASLLAQTNSSSSSDNSQVWRSVLDHSFPRLVVVITFDQFKADLLSRFSHQFLPAYGSNGDVGGFRYLMEKGAYMADAHYRHLPLHTGPGHATIMTGASPRYTGIIANSWYTSSGLTMNCVDDAAAHTIGSGDGPTRRGSSSPKNLLTDTVGDELRLANNRLSKVFGIAIKDRGAILPSGHAANGAVWFDANTGRWVTSSYYTTGTLPAFAQHFNDTKMADRWVGQNWEYLLPEEAYKVSMPEGFAGVSDARGLAATFPKPLSEPGKPADRDYYNHLILTPFGNAMTFDLAKLAVQDEELGQDIYPDILTVSFSTTDLAGHAWGPNSRESQDIILRADRQMSDFLNFLEDEVPGGLSSVMVVVTGDHGGTPLPDWAQEVKLDAGRTMYSDIEKAAKAALAKTFPDKQTTDLVQYSDPHVTLRVAQAEKRGIDVKVAADAMAKELRKLPGVFAAYTRDQIESGQLPRTQEAQMVTNGFNPDRAGEVFLVSMPYHYPSRSKTGSTHGSPWNYDTLVPVIFCGSQVKSGVFTQSADVRDIAPTVSFLLGLTPPAASQGRILSEILK